MPKIAKVKLRKNDKMVPGNIQEVYHNLKVDDKVIVAGERGEELGTVVALEDMVDNASDKPGNALIKIKRIVNAQDNKVLEENKLKEKKAFNACLKKIEEREMPMKLVEAEYSFDQSRITFYFTAEERVDFRELVKDLAHQFKARIEMRQIGVRDEARRLGGYGCCGRNLCCASFLKDFEPVTIKMAKEQRLSLDPNKVSGTCGRLLCCLTYEHSTYKELRKGMPKNRTKVVTEQGPGEIIDINILKQTITVELEEGPRVELPVSKIIRAKPLKRRKDTPRVRRRNSKPNSR